MAKPLTPQRIQSAYIGACDAIDGFENQGSVHNPHDRNRAKIVLGDMTRAMKGMLPDEDGAINALIDKISEPEKDMAVRFGLRQFAEKLDVNPSRRPELQIGR